MNREKLTIVIKKDKHPDKQFDWAFQIQARHRHRECKFRDEDIICQIIHGSIDPFTNFYTKVVMENKGKDADVVLVALQEMGNELWTSAQGRIGRVKEETSMYAGEPAGQPTDTFTSGCACYWCGSLEHKKFNCPKFKAGDARIAGYNGLGKWKGKRGKGGKG